ncbi:class I SAM-dependent methyltransferase [Gorillibacterium massiliense]|uniref:class I SAM-dependent methyltransferase n=1 Tax=Gorillibacterium massiliense TaxID=1280390 RepID=UPI0004B952FD|nr:class I SAM-dependent methyltransferase [Gorillibacterium massiliense]
MLEDVIKGFDANAQDYDKERRKLLPCFDTFYGTAVHLIETDNPAPTILDLGAGTGLLSAFILAKYPNANITLIDLSEKMLERAKERFAGRDNIRYLTGDYSQYSYNETYDYVVSSLSIHHLTQMDKAALFKTVFGILKGNGQFINADQVAGTSSFFDAYYREQWEASIRASGLTEEAMEASRQRRKLDINASVHDQIQWLQEAGFADADCVFKMYDFGVFYAKK